MRLGIALLAGGNRATQGLCHTVMCDPRSEVLFESVRAPWPCQCYSVYCRLRLVPHLTPSPLQVSSTIRHAVWELEEFELERQHAKQEGSRHRDSPAFAEKVTPRSHVHFPDLVVACRYSGAVLGAWRSSALGCGWCSFAWQDITWTYNTSCRSNQLPTSGATT